MATRAQKVALLTSMGWEEGDCARLLDYHSNGVQPEEECRAAAVRQVEDEGGQWWLRKLDGRTEVEGCAAWQWMRSCYPALQFPIGPDVHSSPHYRATVTAVRKADAILENGAWEPMRPEGLRLEIVDTGVGSVVILTVADRRDFEHVLRCLGRKNRPDSIPSTWGAMFLNGVVNAQRSIERGSMLGALFQRDRLILLSRGPYANIRAESLGVSAEQWQRESLALRRAHELSHFILFQLRGAMAKNVTEEVIADADAVWTLRGSGPLDTALLARLLGVTMEGQTSDQARFLTYLPTWMPEGSGDCYAKLLPRAISGLAALDLGALPRVERMIRLGGLSLEELALHTVEP